MVSWCSDRSKILQTPRQRCCRRVCQISERYDNFNTHLVALRSGGKIFYNLANRAPALSRAMWCLFWVLWRDWPRDIESTLYIIYKHGPGNKWTPVHHIENSKYKVQRKQIQIMEKVNANNRESKYKHCFSIIMKQNKFISLNTVASTINKPCHLVVMSGTNIAAPPFFHAC